VLSLIFCALVIEGRRAAARWSVALLMLLALTAGPARGESRSADGVQRAREHFQAGKRAYEEQQYEQALQQFQAGYDLEPRPGFLLNMGHAARKMGKLRRARALYQQFLRTDPPRAERQSAELFLRDIDRELGPEPGLTVPRAVPRSPPPAGASEAAGADLTAQAPAAPGPTPFYGRWWFWGAVGAAVATGVVVGLAVGRGGSGAHDSGTWGQLNL